MAGKCGVFSTSLFDDIVRAAFDLFIHTAQILASTPMPINCTPPRKRSSVTAW